MLGLNPSNVTMSSGELNEISRKLCQLYLDWRKNFLTNLSNILCKPKHNLNSSF